MFVTKIIVLVIGVIVVAVGALLRREGAPDSQLAAIHRADADALFAKGDPETAVRALYYADEAEKGEHLLPGFWSSTVIGFGLLLIVISGIALLW